MKKADINNMELGNILFGHSRGNYHVPREEFEKIFNNLLSNGFDGYGHYKDGRSYFENNIFILRPYYWGDDEYIISLPNFIYKPTGIKIKWYKYPMRDAYCSHNITTNNFKKIIENCIESMKYS